MTVTNSRSFAAQPRPMNPRSRLPSAFRTLLGIALSVFLLAGSLPHKHDHGSPASRSANACRACQVQQNFHAGIPPVSALPMVAMHSTDATVWLQDLLHRPGPLGLAAPRAPPLAS